MTFSFDGHDIGELFAVGRPQEGVGLLEPATVEVPGRDGLAVTGARRAAGTASVRVACAGGPEERRELVSLLLSWLDVDGPRPLRLPGSEHYYLALPQGSSELTRLAGADFLTLSFLVSDPVAYGALRSAGVPSGGSARILVGGTAPTAPSVQAPAAVGSASSGVWGLRLDEGAFVHVALDGGAAREVSLDCARRTCRVAGATAMATLDSDWPELSPGEHVVRMDQGTGAAVLTWQERWY